MSRVAVVGASVGGIVAAAELARGGADVTLFDRSGSVAGLFSKVDTPYGPQELGMHVLYLSPEQHAILTAVLGGDALVSWDGVRVDVGGARTFGRNRFDSVYPDLRGLPIAEEVLSGLLGTTTPVTLPASAADAARARFGALGAEHVVTPILGKLWGEDATELAAGALHCFFDLRRMVLVGKEEADRLKADPWIDQILGNQDQLRPASTVYEGRLAARIRNDVGDLSSRVVEWMHRHGVSTELGADIEIRGDDLLLNGRSMSDCYDACIVASPVHSLISTLPDELDLAHLSIFYFQVDTVSLGSFPSFYMLCHDSDMVSARIVNFAAYADPHGGKPVERSIVAVECTHPLNHEPSVEVVREELAVAFPELVIRDGFAFPKRLSLPVPSLRNATLIDIAIRPLSDRHGSELALTGMRTDQGIFFSHQTVRLAHDAALAYAARVA